MVAVKGKSKTSSNRVAGHHGTRTQMGKGDFDVYSDADTDKKTSVDAKETMQKNTKDSEVPGVKYLDKIKNKAQNPAQVSFGRKALADVSNTRGSNSTRQRFNDSKTGQKASALSSTMIASHISGKAFVGTQAFCTRGSGKSYALKTESIRGSKVFSCEQNNKGKLRESLSTNSRKTVRDHVMQTRKSLPILRKVNLGDGVSEDWKADSRKKGGKCGLPISRKGVSSVKCGRRSLLRNPTSDGFSTWAQRIPSNVDSAETSSKLAEGKLIAKPCQNASNILTMKKVAGNQRSSEGNIAKHQMHESSQTDHMQVRIKSRNPIEATRKSLPVLKQVNLMGASKLKETAEKSENVNSKIYKKVFPPISNARSHLRKRASDGFVSMASRSQVKEDARYLMRKSVKPILKEEVKISNRPHTSSSNKPISVVAMSKNEESNTSSLSQTTVFEHSEKGCPYEKCNLDARPFHDSSRRKSDRRRSYTSLLMAHSKMLKEHLKLERLPNIDDKCNHLEVAEYVDEIYCYYWVTEAQNPSLENYTVIQTDITPQMRGILINWLIEVHFKFDLMQETLYLLVTLLDQYLSLVAVKKNELQLVGLTTLLLASKYEDGCHPKVRDLISISAESYTRNQMLKMENVILTRLKFRLNTPTPYVFMLRFLKAAQSDTKLKHLAFYLLELCLVEYEALKFKPSLLSACAIYVARCNLQLAPAWTSLLSKHTCYEEPKLREGAEMILRFQRVAGTGLLNVTYEKYLSADLCCVARIQPLDRLPL